MQIWHYHPATGELLGAGTADADPMEPGRYAIPAHATGLEPPAGEAGKAPVFVDEAWTSVADHRGETWWDAKGNPITVQWLGDPAASELSPEKPETPISVPQAVTRRQLLLALMGAGIITGEEALASAKTGEAPAAVATVFDSLTEPDRTSAYITWASMLVAERANPLVVMLAASQGMDSAAVDDFFRTAAGL